MDHAWVAIALGDVAWIALAFALGFGARSIGQPPLVGFLATGFVLNYLGVGSGEILPKLADLGITLLLFTIGLKMNPGVLLRPQVWGVTSLHLVLVIAIFGSGILALALVGAPMFAGLDLRMVAVLALSLSFSSTVFAVKLLEEKVEMRSLHGRIAIGILVVQDIVAVIFLAASTGKVPSPWALLLFLLIPMRPLLHAVLERTGHGELLILYGLVLALGGAELFALGGVKDDLGALILGLLISTHPKAAEMSRLMLSLKDLFLVGFFLSVGMTGHLSPGAVIIGILLVPFLSIKSALLFRLMTSFRLRARTSLLATLSLTNYSEFGLIVAAIGVSNGWLAAEWLTAIAIALSISFAVAAPLSRRDDRIYNDFRTYLLRFQRDKRLPEDQLLDIRGATIAVFGMGRVGTGAYDKMRELHGETVVGVDFDSDQVRRHTDAGRNVMRGAPNDADFWDTVHRDDSLEMVMLALPSLGSNLDALEQLRKSGFDGLVAATARYPDDDEALRTAGANSVFNIYAEAGLGFASHIELTER